MGSRASVSETDAEAVLSAATVDYADLDVPGADRSDDVEPLVVASTPEEVETARAFFEDQKTAESDKQVERARTRSGVFSIMQYRHHPETGELMLTQEQLDAGFEVLGERLHHYAYVWHDGDRLVDVDEGTGEFTCIGLKGLHVHMVLWFDTETRPTVRTVSDAFMIPSARVRVPNEVAAQEGRETHRGRNAAEKAFFDLAEYLTHESRGKNAIPGVTQPERYYLVDRTQSGMPGKYQYGRGRVVANFDFGKALDAHMATRHNAAEGGAGAKLSKLFQAVGQGALTLNQVRDQEPAMYFAKGNLAHFQKLRGDFLAHQDAPESVMNFYVFGPGGVGKDLLAKALARALAPDAERPYFKVGGENVSWEGYDGEPVVIWEDMRVGDMIRTAKSRGMLFRILGPWRDPDEQPIVNIKNSHTQLLNRVNIVTGPQDYETFLRGLAGEYVSMQGGVRVEHEAENLDQGFRRFPLIIPVAEHEFSIFVNSGVLNGTREYQSYERHEHMRQDLELLARRCKAIKDAAERERVRGEIEVKTVAPIVAQHDRVAQPALSPLMAEDVLAEFADVGEVIPLEERSRRAHEASSERERVYRDAVEACRRNVVEWMEMCSAHHGIARDDPHLRVHADIWRTGHGCACLPSNSSHKVWPFMADHLERARALDEAMFAAQSALTPEERQRVVRFDAVSV
nr:RNA helicase [Pseudoclavibacter chungangensis]